GEQIHSIMVRPDHAAAPYRITGPLPAILDTRLYSGEIQPVTDMNPLTSEAEALRTTAMATLLETLRDNRRHEDRNVDLFEIGRIYIPRPEDLPDERRVITIAMGGYRSGRALGQRIATDFLDLKGPVEQLLVHFGIEDAQFVPVVHPVFHPGRAALVVAADAPWSEGAANWPPADAVLGIMGEVNREVAEAFDITGQRAYLATLDLGNLMAHGSRLRIYRPLPKYPPVMQDIAVIVDEVIPSFEVKRRIFAAGGDLLRDAALFDVYAGEPIPEGQKSLAYSLTYQATDHTLTDEEVRAVHKSIEDALIRNLGARIRGT
ncbi:MAG: hypothetical protein M0Z94_10030, partial [Dehalococcoidales bacterium]|nr:hypothetical protein [Dehalococcoidales bacterium]